MRIILSACAMLVGVSACDSEGIDRADSDATPVQVSQPVASDDSQESATGSDTPTGTDTSTGSDTPTDTDTASDSDGSSDTDSGSSDDSINQFGGSGSSDGGTTGDDNINSLGGSGSSDGGASTGDDSNTDQPANDPTTDNDASLSTEPPSSGTTYVSTMSPIRSGGQLCISPAKDENGNALMNERGNCPLVQFHGNLAFGDFILATNAWNFCASSLPTWEQCISVDDSSGAVKPRWDYDWGNESDVNGAVWLVKSYPEIIYGIKSPGEYSGSSLAETPAETGLPGKVSELPYYKIDYSFSSDEYPTRSKELNGQTINGERNIAVESFFHELGGDCDVNTLVRNGSSSNQRYEIMVWLDKGPERLPAAPQDYVTSVTLDGDTYDVYTKPSDQEYIAFVAQNPRTTGELNWTTFVNWSRTYAHRVNEEFGKGSNTVQIQDSWCMANILLGTEIWWGDGYFQADEWTIHRTVQ